MAGLAAIPTWVKVAMVAAKAVGTISQGMAAKAGAKAAARELEAQARREEAASQRDYLDAQRDARYVESALLARAGASGAGVSDVTVENLRDDILDQGLYNALTALYNGKSRATQLRYQGAVAREEGRQQQKAAFLKAGFDLGSSAFSQGWFDPKAKVDTDFMKTEFDVPEIGMDSAFKPKLKKSKYNPYGVSIG